MNHGAPNRCPFRLSHVHSLIAPLQCPSGRLAVRSCSIPLPFPILSENLKWVRGRMGIEILPSRLSFPPVSREPLLLGRSVALWQGFSFLFLFCHPPSHSREFSSHISDIRSSCYSSLSSTAPFSGCLNRVTRSRDRRGCRVLFGDGSNSRS